MASVVRHEFEHPPWKASYAEFTFQQFDPVGAPLWSLLRGLHPFSITVEPDPARNFAGSLSIVASNSPFNPPNVGANFAILGDPITAAISVIIDAPFQWIGVLPTVITTGLVRVYVFASPYSRNIQP